MFKPIKIYYHQKATKFMYDNPNIAIGKFSFGKLFSSAWKKGTKAGNVVRGFECACTWYISFDSSAIPEDKFLPSTHFLQNSANFPSASTHTIPSESHKPSGSPVLQSTSDLNEAVQSTNTQENPKAVKTNVLSIIIPTLERTVSSKCRKRQETKTRYFGHILQKKNSQKSTEHGEGRQYEMHS